MTLSRRGFLKFLTVGVAGTAGVSGCSRIVDEYTQPDLPDELLLPSGQGRHPIAHLLNRATYGGRPGQIAEVEKVGHSEWVARQFDYTSIDDEDLDLKLRRFDTLKMNSRDLVSFKSGDDRRYVANELAAATLIRAVYSRRQLYEVMVGFWSDHFSLYHFKESVASLKTADDREVIRPHALGKFGDMLRASAHSPAMLVYLDNILNEKSHPNENYAREIMELHTLGVDGGYTEQDIQEVARCFTGWSVDRRGKFEFLSDWHDDGEKTVLGHTIAAGGGKEDGDRVLEILIDHPSTTRFVCTKLARRFFADDPPADLVDSLSSSWQSTGGDVAAAVREIFAYEAFPVAPQKLKRPFELVASLLRATNAQYDGSGNLIERLDRMGHRPFGWTTPDGYPDTALEWSGNMLSRWNLCLDVLNGKMNGVGLDLDDLIETGKAGSRGEEVLSFFGRLFLSRDLDTAERTALLPPDKAALRWDSDQKSLRELIGLLVASPAFQWR
jgi:uncharacterized protein (DUF1800 family)